jgi:ER-bound oxygenase mpaB/B'/Rubber oxygenase, catalytic domain
VRRDHWQRRIAELDPDVDFFAIYRILGAHEFPWDLRQSLGLALYRTYAVPSIGEVLSRTREFEQRTHKRYADTALLLDAVAEHGFEHPTGRAAIRRMNQMHGRYAISADDMRYVLSTFVVVPTRWLERFGWRPLTEAERVATVRYYRELGRHMNIRDAPATYEGFAALMDAYEAEHFGFSAGGRAVADATLNLLAGFYPFPRLLRAVSLALLDAPLRAAFRYPEPTAFASALATGGLKARARLLRRFPARRHPVALPELREFAIYPGGYRVEELGT